MNLSSKEFAVIAKEVQALRKLRIQFDVHLESDYYTNRHDGVTFTPINIICENPKKLSQVWEALKRKEFSANSEHLRSATRCFTSLYNLRYSADLPTYKFAPQSIFEQEEDGVSEFMPRLISEVPTEEMHDGITYRILKSSSECAACVPHTHPMYDYLDKGFGFSTIRHKTKKNTVYYPVVTNEINFDTMVVLLLCQIKPSLVKQLPDGCFVPRDRAQLLKVKFEKKITNKKDKKEYFRLKKIIFDDYEKTTSLILANKLISGEVPTVSFNDIRFTMTQAEYQNTIIEAPDLMERLKDNLNFSTQFDIYDVIQTYATSINDQMKETGLAAIKLPTVTVNGIAVDIENTEHGLRKINGFTVNKVEVGQALFRASCYRDAREYGLFLKDISKMSIRWHDVIANGLSMKVHDSITREEYKNPEPGVNAPRLKFRIKGKEIHLVHNEAGDTVKVKFAKLLRKVDSANRRTTNDWSRANYNYRNMDWCSRQIQAAIEECITFEVEEEYTVPEEAVIQGDGSIQLVPEHTAKRKVNRSPLRKDEIFALVDLVQAQKLAAIEKSKKYLEVAAKDAKAQLTEWDGRQVYRVKGQLRDYYVDAENARVHNAETGKYICIVNDNHYKGVGYDDVAARLLTLANDSIMAQAIHTL